MCVKKGFGIASAIYTRRVARQYGICWLKKGLSWRLDTLHIFLRNKKNLFAKIEIWNFQHLFDLGFCEPYKMSAHSDNIQVKFMKSMFYGEFCEVSWNSELKICWKFQLFILTNKKVLFLKKLRSVPSLQDSSFFSQQMAPWHLNFPNPRL